MTITPDEISLVRALAFRLRRDHADDPNLLAAAADFERAVDCFERAAQPPPTAEAR